MNKVSEIFSEEKKQRWIIGILLAILFGAVYILNRLFPLFGEDWDYTFFWTMDGQNLDRIQNVSQIFASQYNHYITWGGRSVVHTIDQFLLLIGSKWHDIINSLAYIVLVFLTYQMVNYKNKSSVRIFLFVAFALWFLLPDMPSLILWLTYSAVYMWGTLITVAFMYPFYKYYRDPKEKENIIMSPAMFFFGIIAGWTYENLSLALICFLALILIVMKYLKMQIPRWMILGSIGAVIGCALLILAPGNYTRASNVSSSEISFFYMILYRLWDLLRVYMYNMLILLAIYGCVFYFFVNRAETEDKLKIKLMSLVLVLSAHFGLVVMLASPLFPARTLFGLVIFMTIAIGILFVNIPMRTNLLKSLNWGVICIISIMSCFSYHYRYSYISYFQNFWKQREIYVSQQKALGIEDIIFNDHLIINMDFIESTCDFKPTTDGWPNFSYAKYYDIRSVRRQ